jgi:hypothetical protein
MHNSKKLEDEIVKWERIRRSSGVPQYKKLQAKRKSDELILKLHDHYMYNNDPSGWDACLSRINARVNNYGY